jgi:uncharacterized protein (DUF1330 family)
MPACVVVQIEVEDPARYAEYEAKALRQESARTEMLLIEGFTG